MRDVIKKFLEELSVNAEMRKKFQEIETKEEFIEAAKTYGFELSDEDFDFENTQQLSEDEIKSVAGGSNANGVDAKGNPSDESVSEAYGKILKFFWK